MRCESTAVWCSSRSIVRSAARRRRSPRGPRNNTQPPSLSRRSRSCSTALKAGSVAARWRSGRVLLAAQAERGAIGHRGGSLALATNVLGIVIEHAEPDDVGGDILTTTLMVI